MEMCRQATDFQDLLPQRRVIAVKVRRLSRRLDPRHQLRVGVAPLELTGTSDPDLDRFGAVLKTKRPNSTTAVVRGRPPVHITKMCTKSLALRPHNGGGMPWGLGTAGCNEP
jgi:hypothetical protein